MKRTLTGLRTYHGLAKMKPGACNNRALDGASCKIHPARTPVVVATSFQIPNNEESSFSHLMLEESLSLFVPVLVLIIPSNIKRTLKTIDNRDHIETAFASRTMKIQVLLRRSRLLVLFFLLLPSCWCSEETAPKPLLRPTDFILVVKYQSIPYY